MIGRSAPRRARSLAVSVVLALALAGCGSTLQQTGTQVGAGPGLDGSTGLDAGGAQALGDTTSEGAVASDGLGGPAGAGGAGSPGAGGPAGGGVTNGGPAAPGPGAKASTGPVKVGVIGVDVTALFSIFGAAAPSDFFANDKAFIAHINKTGGIAGRKIEPTFVTVDVQADYNAEGQRACETFTQDKKVDIVYSNNFSNEVLLSCLRQKGVSMMDINRWSSDRMHIDHPNWFTPDNMRVDRYAPAVIDNAVELGVLKRGDKLGVLYEDCPWGGRVYNNVVRPAAARHGVTTEPATVKCVENLVADLGPATNQIQTAVLKFQSANVTHVLALTGAEGFAVVTFTETASKQRYFPKYLITTNAFPYDNADQSGPVHYAADALPNMSGIGFQPILDTGPKGIPTEGPQAAAQAECKRADPKAGTGSETGDARFQLMVNFYIACDAWFTIRNLLQANGVRFSIAEVTNGYRAALAAQPSALQSGGRWALTGSRRDGTGFVQPLKHDPSTGRFMYTGPPRAVA